MAPDAEADFEEAERLARQLLAELDVESVTLLRSGEVPQAAKGEAA